ncbi:MAG: Flp family type IVb pilin [Deferrisomatales bacterium]|nr:Flp family type IVb pilin [Deferrisomatales bacterium]
MRKLIEKMKSLVRDDEGATMVEYAILVALLSVVAIVIIQTLGNTIKTTFTDVNTRMTTP